MYCYTKRQIRSFKVVMVGIFHNIVYQEHCFPWRYSECVTAKALFKLKTSFGSQLIDTAHNQLPATYCSVSSV